MTLRAHKFLGLSPTVQTLQKSFIYYPFEGPVIFTRAFLLKLIYISLFPVWDWENQKNPTTMRSLKPSLLLSASITCLLLLLTSSSSSSSSTSEPAAERFLGTFLKLLVCIFVAFIFNLYSLNLGFHICDLDMNPKLLPLYYLGTLRTNFKFVLLFF